MAPEAPDPAAPDPAASDPVRVGVSSCLLGAEVRFDGGHKRDRFVTDELARHVELVAVCPELEVGMGVPREAVRLVGDATRPRMLGTRSERDWTEPMSAFAARRVAAADLRGLSGFILKSKSPSCGLERVKVYGSAGTTRQGTGLFARALAEADPLLPLEEEGRLHDPGLRERFIVRVFAYHRLQVLLARPRRGRRAGPLVAFHERHKLLLMAHSPRHARALGKLVASVKERGLAETEAAYAPLFMEALSLRATPHKHVNVLQHVLGFLHERVSAAARRDILEVIEDYRNGLLPLVTPVTLLGHYVRTLDIPWVRDQVYLEPHPKELALRNRV